MKNHTPAKRRKAEKGTDHITEKGTDHIKYLPPFRLTRNIFSDFFYCLVFLFRRQALPFSRATWKT